MRVGICIPAVGSHLKYLRKCLECIELQSRKPDIISISVSEYVGPELNYDLSIPIIFTATSEIKDAATNRNIAASKIEDKVDILIFSDIDDFLHPEKVKEILKYFESYGGDCLLHGYLEYSKEDFYKFNPKTHNWPKISGNLEPLSGELVNDSLCGRLYLFNFKTKERYYQHNAHLACKINVWKHVKYPEKKYPRCEDSEYNYRIFKQGFTFMYTNDKLCLYVV